MRELAEARELLKEVKERAEIAEAQLSEANRRIEELEKALTATYEMFMGPHASGSFTCNCGDCGPCEMRRKVEQALAARQTGGGE